MKTNALFTVSLLGALLLGFGSACRSKQPAQSGPTAAVVDAVNRGVALMGQYDYDGAATAFAAALAATPVSTDIQVNLAIARFNRGKKELHDLEESVALLDTVILHDPANVRALYFKGIVLQHQGDAAAAVLCFEKVLQQRPNDGVAWYILGICRQRLNQDAQQELLRAIKLRPYLVSAYYRLWQTLQAANKPDEAAPYLVQFKLLRESSLAETIELPQYNQMGDLALVVPVGGIPRPTDRTFTYRAGAPNRLFAPAAPTAQPAREPVASAAFGGAAFAAPKPTGRTALFLTNWPVPLPFHLQADTEGKTFAPAGAPVRIGYLDTPTAIAAGDYDNDEVPDLFIVGGAANTLFHGAADGSFTAAPDALPAPAAGGHTRSALWLDADHDGDLDLFVCNAGAPNQLFNNNADGTFTDIAAGTDLAESEGDSVMVLPGDIEGDRDVDLVLLRANAPAKIYLNELSGKFRAVPSAGPDIRGDRGGVLQDFNGDGLLDLLVLGGQPAELKLFCGDGHGGFAPSASPADALKGSPAEIRGFRVADVDLDGDLDIAFFDRTRGHLLLNDGTGSFTLRRDVWTASSGNEITGAELLDLTGDLVPDLLLLEHGGSAQVLLAPGEVAPSSTAVAFAPTGVRSRDKRTRSPASGYGVALTVRAGTREQSRLCTGQSGGFTQSPTPLVFGLAGAPVADYARFTWPDGVVQIERALAIGQSHVVTETQRKISSCPVLFTWNGERFEFITDFAGVGGLGYLAAPGEYAFPQPVDHVKIEPRQLREREGCYELRITEPMEESAYFDRLELVAIDHPAGWEVYPDERLTVTGPAPTRELLAVAQPVFAQRAIDPTGAECTEQLRRADRHYAYEPELDRRYCGFCHPHSLELDFGTQLAALHAGERVFLFINGYLEYPYSQTTFAASQSRLGWEPIRIERRQSNGQWQTIVPDAGALGGASRTMTVDLTGLLEGGDCRLRLTSNLEIFYDQIFLGVPRNLDQVRVHHLPVANADLRYVGIAREVSPDGRMPLIYDYQQTDLDVPFASLSGAYTRYGPVRNLLAQEDDQFVLMATGDEIAVTFDATPLLPTPADWVRSFVLVSHAYCKDMDPYTGASSTLEPMPFKGMSRYPYPAAERPPETEAQRRVREIYNTRLVK